MEQEYPNESYDSREASPNQSRQRPAQQRPREPQQQRRPPKRKTRSNKMIAKKTIAILTVIGILILAIGSAVAILSIRSDKPPEEPENGDQDAWDQYEQDMEDYRDKEYSAKFMYTIGILLVAIGLAMGAASMLLGGIHSKLDDDIKTALIAASVTLVIAIIVLVLLAPITGFFPGVPGSGM